MLYKIGQMIRGFLSGGRTHAGHGGAATTTRRRRGGGMMGKVRRLLR